MRTSICVSTFLMLTVSLVALYAQDSSDVGGLSRVDDNSSETTSLFADATTYQEMLDRIPVPERTPFDAEERKRQQYINSFREGFLWASGQHLVCPTKPNDTNQHAIRGWIDGWKAGAKKGGTGGLPARYAPFIAWDASDKGV